MRFGRCKGLFWLAVAFDLTGLALILVGIFANLKMDGRSFGEFLIYSGGIVVFFSLLWWLAWYSGNLEVSLAELEKDVVIPTRTSFKHLARKVSESFSKRKRRRKTSLSTAGKKDVVLEPGLGQPVTPHLPGAPLYCHPPLPFNNSFSPQLDTPIYLLEEGSSGHLELSTLDKLDSQLVIIPFPKEDRLV